MSRTASVVLALTVTGTVTGALLTMSHHRPDLPEPAPTAAVIPVLPIPVASPTRAARSAVRAPAPKPKASPSKTLRPRPAPTVSRQPRPKATVARPSTVVRSSAAAAWANTPKARAVARCESGGSPRAVNPSGKYRGKWQMDSSFWAAYGGRAFALTPDRASESQQDLVAYRGWQARGWSPWSCA